MSRRNKTTAKKTTKKTTTGKEPTMATKKPVTKKPETKKVVETKTKEPIVTENAEATVPPVLFATPEQKALLEKWATLLGVNIEEELVTLREEKDGKRLDELMKMVFRHSEGSVEVLAGLTEAVGPEIGEAPLDREELIPTLEAIALEVKRQDLLEEEKKKWVKSKESELLGPTKALLDSLDLSEEKATDIVTDAAIKIGRGLLIPPKTALLLREFSEEERESFGLTAEGSSSLTSFLNRCSDEEFKSLPGYGGLGQKLLLRLLSAYEAQLISTLQGAGLEKSFSALFPSSGSEGDLRMALVFLSMTEADMVKIVKKSCADWPSLQAGEELRSAMDDNKADYRELLTKLLSQGGILESLVDKVLSINEDQDRVMQKYLQGADTEGYFRQGLIFARVLQECSDDIHQALLGPLVPNVTESDSDMNRTDNNPKKEESVVENATSEKENEVNILTSTFGPLETYANNREVTSKQQQEANKICGAINKVKGKVPEANRAVLIERLKLLKGALDGKILIEDKRVQAKAVLGKLKELAEGFGIRLTAKKKSGKIIGYTATYKANNSADGANTGGADMATDTKGGGVIVETKEHVATSVELNDAPGGAGSEAEVDTTEVAELVTPTEVKEKQSWIEGEGFIGDVLSSSLDRWAGTVDHGLELQRAKIMKVGEGPVCALAATAMGLSGSGKGKEFFLPSYKGNEKAEKLKNEMFWLTTAMESGRGTQLERLEAVVRGEEGLRTQAIFSTLISAMMFGGHQREISAFLPDAILKVLTLESAQTEDKVLKSFIDQLAKAKPQNQNRLFLQLNKRRLTHLREEETKSLSKGHKAELNALQRLHAVWEGAVKAQNQGLSPTSFKFRSGLLPADFMDDVVKSLLESKVEVTDKHGKAASYPLFKAPVAKKEAYAHVIAGYAWEWFFTVKKNADEQTGETIMDVHETLIALTATRSARIRDKMVWYVKVAGYGIVSGLCSALSIATGVVSAVERVLMSGYAFVRSLFAKEGEKETWRAHAMRHLKAAGKRVLEVATRTIGGTIKWLREAIFGKSEESGEKKDTWYNCEGWRRTLENGEKENVFVSVVAAPVRAVYKLGAAFFGLFSKSDEKKAVTDQKAPAASTAPVTVAPVVATPATA